ncbi:beta-galactosidase/beta-glucuronidase [Enterococcus sp. PF1-24]|uniref:glycoside hydrolase family 2 protein n=1 Tax=unclassified Enterococcus TaxID=2608891 RepID=UPI002474ED5D|nr:MULTISPECIES: sugar-binding domain-containing protein [unclassified Enterococcus]MDH6363989.1 beta-galactosidase/beta-glucuronidase [Enterococcus sp. PFB1-1]MDH6401090.1 beta-galactosidase/beta-glucuronidase [Enterococcus sp. PF1-24]
MTFRNEYPRPQFVRERWTNLNGDWNFMFDDKNIGCKEMWYNGQQAFTETINVPFVYQTKMSGIHVTEPHEIVWYQRNIQLKKQQDKRYLLHFGAVDYLADIYVNGQHVMQHEGGHTSFSVDVTDYLSAENSLVVRVYDPLKDESIPRGKQFWENESRGIWYTNTTGIWQTVWLEEVADIYLTKVKMTPLYDNGKIRIQAKINQPAANSKLKYKITFKGDLITAGCTKIFSNKVDIAMDLFDEMIFRHNFHGDGYSWTPENPQLFDIQFELLQAGELKDQVLSYFGFRKIHHQRGMVYLNNKPYYQKLVLDQGYWPESLMTAPEDAAFIEDIKLAKEMGFNGCRKHQKTEDPRFLYWADKLGYLVWGECASAPAYNEDAVKRLMVEWQEIIERDYNHPCIITWVPLNESWGIPDVQHNRQQQHFSQTMYHYLHSLDTTRLVISNDGWAITESDICAIHNYAHGNKEEEAKYQYFKDTLKNKENILAYCSSPWDIYANGFSHQGEPVLLTEFGGIGFDVSGQPGWGYTSVGNEEEFVSEYGRVMAALYASEILYGFCYTQLTDVEQEINGVLTYDRKPKCDLSLIKAINDRFHMPQIKG